MSLCSCSRRGIALRDSVLMACTRAKAELHSIFETNQLESIFQLVRSGFGVTLVPQMASSHAAGCALVPYAAATPGASVIFGRADM